MLLDCKARSNAPTADFWAPLRQMSIIVVDGKRLDPGLLTPDPLAHSTLACWKYSGVIDVQQCTVRPAADVFLGLRVSGSHDMRAAST